MKKFFEQYHPLQMLAVLGVIVIAFLLSIHTLTSINQDIGRHLRLGEIIWQTHHIPHVNLFSYTAGDFSFINHHWLSEVVFYLLNLKIGLSGLIIFKALVVALTYVLLIFAFFKKESIFFSCLFALDSIFIFIERTDVRPEIFSYLFLSWFLFVLMRRKEMPRLLWTLPVVQLIWVNSHIYFFLGPALMAFIIIGDLINMRFDRNLWLAAILSGLVLLLNPFGLAGALYPLRILSHYGYSIVENKSTFFLQSFGYPQLTSDALFVGMALLVISFAFNYKRIRENSGWLIFSIFAGAMSIMMIRNFPIFALAMVPIGVQNMYQAGLIIDSKKIFIALNILLVALGLSIVNNQIYNQASLGRRFGLIVPTGAQAAVDFVRQNHIIGPMFNNFDIGSYLIWKLPEEKVFIDGRPEAYPEDFIQNVYIPMQEDPALWAQKSKEYNIQFIFWNYTDITPWSQQFLSFIVSDPQWPLIYRDGSVAIFVKNTPEHRHLIDQYKLR